MTRHGAVFWFALVLIAGFTTFKVKYAVQDVEDELNRVRKQTVAEQQEIRVLTAEWTFLNQPQRLAELNRRFLGLASITPKQLQRGIDEIPLRAPAAPVEAAPTDATPEAVTLLDPPVEAMPDTAVPQAAASETQAAPAAPSPAPASPAAPGQADASSPRGEGPHRLGAAAPVQLAKAAPVQAASSLDALIAQIAEDR